MISVNCKKVKSFLPCEMIVKIPIFTLQGWIIEQFRIFDTCIYCGWFRSRAYECYYQINGKKARSWRCKCGCGDAITDLEIVEEDNIIEELRDRGIEIIRY